MNNPFQQSMVRMQMPPGAGASISLRGFSIAADEHGCVTVPVEYVPELSSHGLTKAAEQEAPPKKK